jgi:hypothetical protein
VKDRFSFTSPFFYSTATTLTPIFFFIRKILMTFRVTPVITESTRNLGKSTLYFFLTIAAIKASHSLYRCIRSLTMSSSSSSTSNSTADASTLRRNRILSSKLYFDVPLSKVCFLRNKVTSNLISLLWVFMFDQAGTANLLDGLWYFVSWHGKAVR